MAPKESPTKTGSILIRNPQVAEDGDFDNHDPQGDTLDGAEVHVSLFTPSDFGQGRGTRTERSEAAAPALAEPDELKRISVRFGSLREALTTKSENAPILPDHSGRWHKASIL